ncbi:GNAT family N-acetyltransferase [Evansella tamaricis]|uniref:GNAT family N-acetyltransferase n=1 Tax=Evansella tamaricis TaxID=2069301 RepID=A0ABS6JGI3_9BACI|nr:GNAT family N-acetyltransferase [Evansella tamaricis]MBU9711428.1 GNAT family N-acetyltransferase [Evansella tamaricis]
MKIRPAVIGDEKQIASVHVKSWQSAYRNILPDDFLSGLSVEQREKMWRSALERPLKEHGVYVAEDSCSQIIGFANGGPNRSKDSYPDFKGELNAIYLLEESWGNGTGSQLVEAVTHHLKGNGLTSMLVWAFADNPPARKFYEKLGAVFLGEGTININGIEYGEVVYGWKTMPF